MDVSAEARHGPGRRWLRHSSITVLAAGAILGTAVVPATANEPGAPGDGPTSCEALDPAATTTLDEVRAQIGAPDDPAAGNGVGVAIIDTGINPVPGLDAPGKIIDGTDLSLDGATDDLRDRDLHGHGTNMAAIIAGDGGAYGSGVAPGAHLVNVKVGAGDGQVDVSQVIAAIDWIVQNRSVGQNNIRVLNLSFDTDATQSYLYDPLARAVENAWEAGITVVVAAGNDGLNLGRLGNPARDPFVIAVGGAQADGDAWSVPPWSSAGDGARNPDVLAPGSAVLSAGVPGSFLAENHPGATCRDAQGGLQLRGSGTSQSAAVVAGAAAVLLQQRPQLTPDQVKYVLSSTARSIGAEKRKQGSGVLDLAAALAAPTPGVEAVQTHRSSNGLGSLDQARGTRHIEVAGKRLEGERTAFGRTWDGEAWRGISRERILTWRDLLRQRLSGWDREWWKGRDWSFSDSDGDWSDALRSLFEWGSNWSGATWSGATWSGATWSGATWSGATWSGATWSGATWSGATWSGATWSGATWSGASWG